VYNVILSLLSASQSKEKEMELFNADWRDCDFTDDKALTLAKGSSIYMCMIAHDDDDTCKYAICEGCKEEHQPIGRQTADDREARRVSCHHEIRNLDMAIEPYWCGTKYIHGKKWENKPQGCSGCKRKFIGAYAGGK